MKKSSSGSTLFFHLFCRWHRKKLDNHGKEDYNYNQKNQLVSRSWNGGYTAYAYDLQGNLLTATGTEGRTAFSYNAFNQQTAVAMPNGNRLESRYDAEYLRAGTTENGSVTSFSYYNGELLAESSSDDDTISRYILGYGVAAGWNREKEGYHPYHLDEQNSTAYITGINGQIENHYQYDAFGVVQTHREEIHNRILYTGQQYDQSSGQYYLRARYYNPVVGRFLQEDVYRGDGLNLYAYCKNNPVVYYDPSGYNNDTCQKDAIEVGKADLDALRKRIGVMETDTVAVGKTNVKGLEGRIFEGESPKVRREAGLPDVDEIWSDRNIKSPGKGRLFTRHAEELVANDFDRAVMEAGIDSQDVVGVLKIHQSNAAGVCTKCIQGLANDTVAPGVLKQLSMKYPNLRIEVTSETLPFKKIVGRRNFVIQNGKYVK